MPTKDCANCGRLAEPTDYDVFCHECGRAMGVVVTRQIPRWTYCFQCYGYHCEGQVKLKGLSLDEIPF